MNSMPTHHWHDIHRPAASWRRMALRPMSIRFVPTAACTVTNGTVTNGMGSNGMVSNGMVSNDMVSCMVIGGTTNAPFGTDNGTGLAKRPTARHLGEVLT